jgi:hypothetical protein
LVYQGKMSKTEAFDKHATAFKLIAESPISENSKKREEFYANINECLPEFNKVMQSVDKDNDKAMFFKEIDDSLNSYIEIMGVLTQGSGFYAKLGELLNKLYQK